MGTMSNSNLRRGIGREGRINLDEDEAGIEKAGIDSDQGAGIGIEEDEDGSGIEEEEDGSDIEEEDGSGIEADEDGSCIEEDEDEEAIDVGGDGIRGEEDRKVQELEVQ